MFFGSKISLPPFFHGLVDNKHMLKNFRATTTRLNKKPPRCRHHLLVLLLLEVGWAGCFAHRFVCPPYTAYACPSEFEFLKSDLQGAISCCQGYHDVDAL